MSAVRGDGARVVVSGAVTIDTAPALVAAGGELVQAGATRIDLAAATDIDSAAISLALEWQRVAHAAGRALTIEQAPAAFVKLAKLYGVADLLPAAAR